MTELQQLVFAQKFPFSSTAKGIVRESGFGLSSVPEDVLNRAALMVSRAWKKQPYKLEVLSEEILLSEVLAFPVAKIFVSFINEPLLNERFAFMFSDSAFFYLEKDRSRTETALELARDFGLMFSLAEREGFFASLKMADFLKSRFSSANLKLVNQPLERGAIFLTEEGIARFVSQFVFGVVLDSLPVSLSGIPDFYKKAALQIKRQLKPVQLKKFELQLPGNINTENFSPCMKDMYFRLFSGENLPHMARFDLAAFLIAIGMPLEQIDALFSRAPNYSQKTTIYHLKRIARLELSPPSCKKVREHGYCPLQNCSEKHPLLYYSRKSAVKPILKKPSVNS